MGSLSHIRRVDIELQSFCNRTCDWCPNKDYLRNKSVALDDVYYTKILNELNQFGFAPDRKFPTVATNLDMVSFNGDFARGQPTVSFMGFQEPMADIKLLKRRVIEAKETLPSYVVLSTNTNGDYFTKKNLDGLFLTTLNVMDYDCKGKDYWIKTLEENDCMVIDDPGKQYQGLLAVHKSINLIKVVYDWPKQALLENRAGVLSKDEQPLKMIRWKNDSNKRVVPCPEPSYYINITFDGSVMPCCHIRSDIPIHKDYILGNVKENTLEEILNSPKAIEFRQRLTVENGDYPDPCKYCQKIRSNICTGAPNGFNYIGKRYMENKVNENVRFINDFNPNQQS